MSFLPTPRIPDHPVPPLPQHAQKAHVGAHAPRRIFTHYGHDEHARLRGRAAFDMWRALGWPVDTGDTLDLRSRPAEVLLAVPDSVSMVGLLQRVRIRTDVTMAVDVAFPLGHPDAITGGPEAVAHWSNPEHQVSALRAVELADVVTTPWPAWEGVPDWLDELRVLNPNVVVLPDLAGDGDEIRFAEELLHAWDRGRRVKWERLAG